MRAHRPSYMSLDNEYDEDTENLRQANVARYSQRADEGLPLFDSGQAGDNRRWQGGAGRSSGGLLGF